MSKSSFDDLATIFFIYKLTIFNKSSQSDQKVTLLYIALAMDLAFCPPPASELESTPEEKSRALHLNCQLDQTTTIKISVNLCKNFYFACTVTM